MKFWRIVRSVDQRETGNVYPYSKVDIPLNIDNNELILNHFFKKVNVETVVTPIPFLHPKAKLVDLMPGIATGEIISEKFKKLIEETCPIGIQFIVQKLMKAGGNTIYYWLTNHYEFDYSVIDFRFTEICIMKSTWEEDFKVKVKNEGEFVNLIEDTQLPKSVKIFRPYFLGDYKMDFFALRFIYNGFSFFCSDRFREKLEAEKITGIRYMELDEVL